MSPSLSSVAIQIIIYCGTPVFVLGILGGVVNIVVFLSLRTFRQNSCAFYLLIMSIVNIGQLCTGLLSRILNTLLSNDGTETSRFYCKFRLYLFHICIETSLTCFCLATIDQYFATCFRPRWQQFCNIKLARRIVILSIVIWILHGISYLVYYDHVISSSTNEISCAATNFIFLQYRNYVILIVFSGLLPIIVATISGLLAYHNIRHIGYRTVPLVRRELDKQLTIMVLVQVLVNIFTLLPYTIINALSMNSSIISNPIVRINLQFASMISLIGYYIYFASPFYIYICASERFRKQAFYVLFRIHINRWKKRRMTVNQIIPEC